jgi:hypothetical protein
MFYFHRAVVGLLWVEREGEFFVLKEGFHGRKLCHFLSETLVPCRVLRNSKLPLTGPLTFFCNWSRFVAEVRMMGGGLPAWFAGSCWASSVPVPFRHCCLPSPFAFAAVQRIDLPLPAAMLLCLA